MICKDEAGDIVRTPDVLGKDDKSFKIHIPTSSRLYTSINQIWEGRDSMSSSIPYHQQMATNTHLQNSKTVQGCNEILGRMGRDEKQNFKNILIDNLSRNTPKKHETEDLSSYLNRRAHRNPDFKQHKSIKIQKKRRGRNNKKKTEMQIMLDIEKWGKENKEKENEEKNNDGDVDDISITFFGDEDNEEDIFLHVVNADNLDHNAEDLLQMKEKSTRINCAKELGDWITSTINAHSRTVTCNCEDYLFCGTCCHSASFDLIHFG